MKKLVAFLALAFAALALVACGSSSNNSTTTTESKSGGESTESQAKQGGAAKEEAGGGGGSTISFEADPSGELAYTETNVTAKAGKVTIDFKNPQSLAHDVAIENSKGEEVAATEPIASGSDSTTATLEPGTYKFFCTIPGHREAGMEGVLVVK